MSVATTRSAPSNGRKANPYREGSLLHKLVEEALDPQAEQKEAARQALVDTARESIEALPHQLTGVEFFGPTLADREPLAAILRVWIDLPVNCAGPDMFRQLYHGLIQGSVALGMFASELREATCEPDRLHPVPAAPVEDLDVDELGEVADFDANDFLDEKPKERCPDCGGMVVMPCVACNLRRRAPR
ncbi:MAG: hypothetical protein ACYTG0_17780 [Planctomycetota bacterium]